MSFAQELLAGLSKDLPALYSPLFLVVLATCMLWPFGSWMLRSMPKHKWSYVTLFGLGLAWLLCAQAPSHSAFNGMFQADGLAKGFQGLCILGGLITVALSQPQLNTLKEQTVEYYALILFAVSGMLLLVGSTDLVSFYFSLELMALCIYVLVAYLREHERSIEAGLKYFLLGAFSSGILLYGISLLFAAGGGVTTNLNELGQKLMFASPSGNGLIFLGVLMVLIGCAFKVAAVPFHMWSPDAYEGAPTPITAFMTMAPKAAALAAFLRIFGFAFRELGSDWMMPLGFLAGASMVVGNIAALRQTSFKRMLAYSSIGHVGYMLLGILSAAPQAGASHGDPQGAAQALWLYMFTYLIMQSGAFALIIYIQGKGQGERIDDFRGLAKRNPVLAFSMMVFMLGLAGIPPLLGFFSKFYLFKLSIEQGHVALTVLALLTSAIAAYYYLNVVANMYFREAIEDTQRPIMDGPFSFILTGACMLVLLGTFFGQELLQLSRIVGLG